MPDKINDALSERLSELVALAPKSQNAIARELDIGERAFSNYVRGREPQDRSQLNKIADYFGVSLAFLLGLTDNPSPISSGPLHTPLTGTPNNGLGHSKEGSSMADSELYRSIMLLSAELSAMRQDVRQLFEKVRALEAAGGNRPSKGRKAKS